MEGVGVAVTVLIAVTALVIAIVALGLLVRSQRLSGGDPMSAARYGALERRVSQLGQRLEVVEGDIDSGRGDGTAGPTRTSSGGRPASGSAISHIGLIRFDAFDDAGGGQSFALSLLDDEGDGVVLTSLHSRQSTRVYVKDIRGGVADAPLSAEEERSLRAAGLV
jgi:hypothetical protein